MMKVAICDDNKYVSDEINKMLLECCSEFKILVDVDIYDKGKNLEESIIDGKYYDLLYLDIRMEDQDGIETARNIRKLDQNVLIIYVSGYDQYIEDIFDVSALNFIHKPIKKERFKKTLWQVYEKMNNKAQYFEFAYGNKIKRIAFHEIVYFESHGRKIIVYLQNGEIESFNGKISNIESEINVKELSFIRVHQSFLVNFEYITNRTRMEITVASGDKIPISKDRQKHFLTQYTKYLKGEIHE